MLVDTVSLSINENVSKIKEYDSLVYLLAYKCLRKVCERAILAKDFRIV